MLSNPTKIIVNSRVTLTALLESDLADLVEQLNDQYIYENTVAVPYPYQIEHARVFLEHTKEFAAKEGFQKDWVIRFDGNVAGGIGAMYNYGTSSHKSEIGYWLGKEYRGRGLMSDVIAAYVKYIFVNTSLIRLEAQIFVGNRISARVLEKNGFAREGTAQSALVKDGEEKDVWLYARLKKSNNNR